MPQRATRTLESLKTLFEAKRGTVLPLTPSLARLYGCLRMPRPRARPHVISNFVTTLDGIVSLQVKGHSGGGDISGFDAQDRMVMGLLRAIADVVIVGAGALNADRRHVWTAETVFPELAAAYRQLREAMGKRRTPLNVVVSGNGKLDLRLPCLLYTSRRTRRAPLQALQDLPCRIAAPPHDEPARRIGNPQQQS